MYTRILDDLRRGAVRLLDGGTGTELQRRGVAMAQQAWCGTAALTNLPTLEEVHRDYIAAGADVITANTYASSRLMLDHEGLADRFEEINGATVQAARDARDAAGRPEVLIAGSLSHRGPIATGTDRPDRGAARSIDDLVHAVSELADFLREAGCDLLLLEMMYDPARMGPVFEAASRTGLPVWAGFSARRGRDGQVLGFGPEHDIPFAEVVSILSGYEIDAAGVMHTPADLVSDALDIVRNTFDGPLMAYPDSGYFKSPYWEFERIMQPEELRAFGEQWIARGAQVLGGCCGLSPAHISALRPLRRDAKVPDPASFV